MSSPAATESAATLVGMLCGTVNALNLYESSCREFAARSATVAKSVGNLHTFSKDRTFDLVSTAMLQFSECLSRHIRAVREQVIAATQNFIESQVHDFSQELISQTKDSNPATFIKDFEQFKSNGLPLFAEPIGSFGRLVGFMCSDAHGVMKDMREDLQRLQISRRRSTSVASDVKDHTLDMASMLHECIKTNANMSKKFTGTTALEHEGYVESKEKKWKKVFLKIRRTKLYFCKSDSAHKVKSSIPLLLATVKQNESNLFQVITPNSSFDFRAQTEFDRDQWVAIINNNIAYCLSGDDEKAKTAKQPFELEWNKVCADCGAPNPKWCCINWGTCVCIECSGVHRSLTTTVSKVRSLTMDNIDPLTMEMFSVIGNVNANKILEEKPIEKRITPMAARGERRDFITAKYKEHEFCVEHEGEMAIKDAIKSNNHIELYRAICHGHVSIEVLHYAACVGNALTCLMVALNAENMDALDENGWSALSYAGYYGNADGAQGLLAAGCSAMASLEAHPYETARAMKHDQCMRMFTSFWDMGRRPQTSFDPLIKL